jgi:hypothetical protein
MVGIPAVVLCLVILAGYLLSEYGRRLVKGSAGSPRPALGRLLVGLGIAIGFAGVWLLLLRASNWLGHR